MRITRNPLSLLLPSLLLLSACAGSMAIQSVSVEKRPTIDGDPADWEGGIAAVEDAPFSFGIQHDDDFLYLAISSVNRDFTQQLLRTGLILWFDVNGSQEKTSGLRFPRGMMDLGSIPRGEQGDRSAQMTPGERASFMENQLQGQQATLSFVGREGSSWSMDVDALQGMNLSTSLRNGRFFYEASIPLSKGPERSFSLGFVPGDNLALCIEVPQADMPSRDKGRSGGMGGRSGGKGGGMGRGRSGGMSGPPAGMNRPEAIEHWFRIELN
jgi:hypothetical protein